MSDCFLLTLAKTSALSLTGYAFLRSRTHVLTKFHADIKTNILTECYEDWTINVTFRAKNAPPPDIIWTNLLTKFHYNQTVNVASRVLTRKNARHIIRTNVITKQSAQPPGGHFHEDRTIHLASRVLTWNNLVIKFPEDRTINVASKVLTGKNDPPTGSHVFQATETSDQKAHHEHIVPRRAKNSLPYFLFWDY
ncbi:hypothetical protein DPMN_176331 [Dreissena polymorpha]|uniref:Uncharacterized protein n=1 Tax=Dreissena polymorpha TaxID=45954 RepID=A0A9D4IJJ1_DREPO|nr:hypothetical protein DPMN_176331 [Dreissena polymorpha]